MTSPDVGRSAILNEQELWREMVRWSGGLVHEQDGLLFVAGPSSYLRVAIRMDGGSTAPRRCVARGVLRRVRGWSHRAVREPDDADLAQAALAAGYTPGMDRAPDGAPRAARPSPLTAELDVRVVSTPSRSRLRKGRR